jgi:hypothetical protein
LDLSEECQEALVGIEEALVGLITHSETSTTYQSKHSIPRLSFGLGVQNLNIHQSALPYYIASDSIWLGRTAPNAYKCV